MSSDEEESRNVKRIKISQPDEGLQSMYLGTIDRKKLDFDFDRLCSVSLSNTNIYACLVCGKYYQGRGLNSYAYLHSMDYDHHVFMNLDTLKVYALPEGYEIKDDTLEDIKAVADPRYSKQQINDLDRLPETFDLSRKLYLPGYMGLNNIKQNDYANVVFQAIAHVAPLRNYLILEPVNKEPAKKFGLMVRKLWNSRAFKPHVSPQELMEYLSSLSNQKFSCMHQQDPFVFMNWFVNQLHMALGGSRSKPQSSIVQKCFQGELVSKGRQVRFMFVSMDLPPVPLFRDQDDDQSVVAQVSLTTLISKTEYEFKTLPPYLTLHFKRFTGEQRNETVVSFNPQSLVINDTSYRLLANIVIDATSPTSYKIQLLDKARDCYQEIHDIKVEQTQPELLVLSEAYIQIWERL